MNNLHRVPYTCIWSGDQRVALVSVTMLPLFDAGSMTADQLVALSQGINSAMRCAAANNDRWRTVRVRVSTPTIWSVDGCLYTIDVYPGQHPDDLAVVKYLGEQK